MKKFGLVTLFLLAAISLSTIAVLAQASMSSWPLYLEVTPAASGINEITVPLHVMDKSRQDLADLRLADATGREIPYALRIRKEVDDKRQIAANLFNEVTAGSNATEVSVDLGENPGEHNEVEIETTGTNFRRRVDVEGSDNGKEWRTIKTGDVIFGFESGNSVAESNRVRYPTSRYRYLRVRVYADEIIDKVPPGITLVKVLMTVRDQGQQVTWDLMVPLYQLLRNQGAPASSWTIDLGARVPCDKLIIETNDESFSRSFQLEDVDDPQNIRLIAEGELTRRISEQSKPVVITIDNDKPTRKLRLLVLDYNNPILSITSIKASAAARQLFFELKEPAQPLRLYYGNPNALAPHYDFEKELPAKLSGATPSLASVTASLINPDFKPEPLPLTERIPWLIYIVLTISSIALALILFSLARATSRMEAKPPAAADSGAR
jgi:uncharacterized protein DUF3999